MSTTNIVGNQPNSIYSRTSGGGYIIPAPQSWKDFFNTVAVTNPSGVYTFTVICRTANDGTDLGDFPGTVQFSSGSFTSPASAPTVTAGSVVSGTVRVGSRVSCAVTFSGASTITYAWLSNGSTISGASSKTYSIPSSLLKHSLACRATGSNGVGSKVSTSPAKTVGYGRLIVSTKPVLSGPHVHGSYEKVSTGTWSPRATSYTYQWYVGSTKIRHATSYRYLVPAAYAHKKISVIVYAHRTGYLGSYHTAGVTITR